MLRELLSGNGSFDPSQLAGAAGLPSDPASLAALMSQLQGALRSSGDGINWDTSLQQAKTIAGDGAQDTTPEQRAAFEQAFHIASLWLADVTDVAELSSEPALYTRTRWATKTMPFWTQLAEPVATNIANALTGVLTERAPEELSSMIANAGQLVRGIGGTLFAMQLGQVVGQLSKEVVSGGDIGIPLLDDNEAALVPQNVADFGEGLDIPADQVQIYLAVRELAHARLFRHARWLRLHLISSITDFARGIRIDTERLEELAESFDPSNPEELRDAMTSGALIPARTEAQDASLARLETTLALIEGWVDVVTAAATERLPRSAAIAETVRRRRAAGGPAEQALGALVGLELRPRRLREAAQMWQQVTDAVGTAQRDALWSHPDLVPTAADIDAPEALIQRLEAEARGERPEQDEMDLALEDLLRGEERGDQPDDEPGSEPSGPNGAGGPPV
ncbi:zinc-dependent metalloprotease [Plantibacter sp. ME-Dv--P-122b]|uniref:zinc-dependent metalloprotease n=1 Tax=Plantibacter sp. ME-Dv--P-122b TaxID=3040300 RepID=UPI0025506245|nr:zinc-dependent metalloprotease [Plantibacter sp. ME-Dv--P-122b]